MRARALEAIRCGRWAEAAEAYHKIAVCDKRGLTIDDATNFGAVLRTLGRTREAKIHYEKWISKYPGASSLRLNAINCLIDLEDYDMATRWADEGLQQEPDDSNFIICRARLYRITGEAGHSRELLEELVRRHPKIESAWLELGAACEALRDHAGAHEASKKVTELNPDSSCGWGNQIITLKNCGKWRDASELAQGLPRHIRSNPEVTRAVASLYMDQQLFSEAEKELEMLCRLRPDQGDHWLNRAACLRQLKHFLTAEKALKSGLLWSPRNVDLKESLGHCMADIGKARKGVELLRSCLDWNSLSDVSHASLQFIGAGYNCISSWERQQLALAWEKRSLSKGVGTLWADRIHKPLAGRRLRVGYLSADLSRHPVGRFLLPVLENHDRRNVELWGLSCGPHNDKVTEALKSHCDHWVDLQFGTDLEIARRIADIGLDVLIELGGYTGSSRIGVLTHKPCPVQLSYLGYFAPTYIRAIDGWIGDAVLFGSLNEIDRKAHRLIEISDGYMVYRDSDLPTLKRVDDTSFRFGSFNHSRKLGEESVSLFCEVMSTVAGSKLVLKSVSFVEPEERERTKKMFMKAGLNPDRLKVLPWIKGRDNHLDSYKEIDVGLDPIPYGGATTTCEALWMGVPVITMAGEGMVGRLSASILYSANQAKYVARDRADYVCIAKRAAADGPRSIETRKELRRSLERSPLGNGMRLARELETHYSALAREALDAAR